MTIHRIALLVEATELRCLLEWLQTIMTGTWFVRSSFMRLPVRAILTPTVSARHEQRTGRAHLDLGTQKNVRVGTGLWQRTTSRTIRLDLASALATVDMWCRRKGGASQGLASHSHVRAFSNYSSGTGLHSHGIYFCCFQQRWCGPSGE